jgi:hypothetical protein
MKVEYLSSLNFDQIFINPFFLTRFGTLYFEI